MPFCMKCGMEIPEDAEYCHECGKKVDTMTKAHSHSSCCCHQDQ
ncbi:MAG: zinc-ribbon domain-containing protein [Candidatus Bathyarchaeota archaeon]|nr:zinc-ribbon domain-containing protein [Candidatus Bathyarchaeota archaeon]